MAPFAAGGDDAAASHRKCKASIGHGTKCFTVDNNIGEEVVACFSFRARLNDLEIYTTRKQCPVNSLMRRSGIDLGYARASWPVAQSTYTSHLPVCIEWIHSLP